MLDLVVPAREDEERDAVIAAWLKKGWHVHHLERFWEPPPLEREAIRLYGDMTFCLFLAQKLKLELLSPPDDLVMQISPQWLRRQVQSQTLADALHQTYPLFAKSLIPKIFHASVYTDPAMLEEATKGLSPDTLIIVAEPVIFTSEARCLVLKGEIVSVSVYEGKANAEEARVFAQAFINSYQLPITFVLDVGWIERSGWAIIEVNAIWGAGLNGCDPVKMADCLAVATKS